MSTAAPQALQLRDIHLPAAPGIWPPAPGWWALAALLMLLIAVAAWLAWRRHRAHAAKRHALRTLDELASDFRAERSPESLARISILLRRIALARFARREVASLTGPAWLRFLDESGGAGRFSQGAGQVLAGLPYQRSLPADLDADALLSLVREWVQKNLARPS